MSSPASQAAGSRPHLRLVSSTLSPMMPGGHDTGWRRVASAVLASTWDISRYVREQRWGRVHEELTDRRELLGLMRTLQLDVNGRSALRALDEAALESERAIAAMMGKSR
ncbi:MAG TPA: hypothetical protein VFS58_09405 [Steroidobacteraceae bacterium]|nr:hypothetical protein [Steroidobacteraceae bacterium]